MRLQAYYWEWTVRSMSSYMQRFDSHKPLWHAPLPRHFREEMAGTKNKRGALVEDSKSVSHAPISFNQEVFLNQEG